MCKNIPQKLTAATFVFIFANKKSFLHSCLDAISADGWIGRGDLEQKNWISQKRRFSSQKSASMADVFTSAREFLWLFYGSLNYF